MTGPRPPCGPIYYTPEPIPEPAYAAPSQVSDADSLPKIEAAGVYAARLGALAMESVLEPGTRRMLCHAAYLMRELRAAQPQPGRVEGMVLVPVDEIERAVKVMRYAAHPHTSPNADALAKFIAPSPTAGGDA